jgi:stage II sporulation protein AB (anti-sigma F factor)
MNNEMSMEFDAISENESFARMAVAAFVMSLNPTLEELSDIKTAVSEAVTNAIIHGYGNEVHKILIRCRTEGKTLFLEIEDSGKGMDDVQKAMEPLFTTKPEMERSGMGFSFMEAFMDELHVTSKVGEGTTVRMRKKIGRGVRTGSEAGFDRSSNHMD